MRKRRCAVVAATMAVALAAGCGGGSDDAGGDGNGGNGDNGSPEENGGGNGDQSGGASALTQEQAEAALLTADDLPGEWRETSLGDSAAGDMAGQEIEPAECSVLFDSFEQLMSPTVEAQTVLSRGELGPFLSLSVNAYDQAGADVVGELASTLDECPRFTSTTENGFEVEFESEQQSLPELGDRSYASRFIGTMAEAGQTMEYTVDLALVANGQNVAAFSTVGITEPLGGDEWETIVTTGADKLAEASAGR